MRPSKRGRRYKNSRNGVSVYDGPFIETKELIAGYVSCRQRRSRTRDDGRRSTCTPLKPTRWICANWNRASLSG